MIISIKNYSQLMVKFVLNKYKENTFYTLWFKWVIILNFNLHLYGKQDYHSFMIKYLMEKLIQTNKYALKNTNYFFNK